LKANFNSAEPRDDKGLWTDEGGDGDHEVIIPASAGPRSRRIRGLGRTFPTPTSAIGLPPLSNPPAVHTSATARCLTAQTRVAVDTSLSAVIR
jgi:hypothetical protein